MLEATENIKHQNSNIEDGWMLLPAWVSIYLKYKSRIKHTTTDTLKEIVRFFLRKWDHKLNYTLVVLKITGEVNIDNKSVRRETINPDKFFDTLEVYIKIPDTICKIVSFIPLDIIVNRVTYYCYTFHNT